MTLLTVKASRSKIAYSKPTEVFVAITFNPPKIDSAQRAPISLSVSLDNSGSMGEPAKGYSAYPSQTKLDLAKIAVQRLIENLSERDTLGFVTFEESARVIFSPMPMTATNKAEALSKLEAVQPAGGTALHDGLLLSIGQVRDAKAAGNALHRTMLFTDGQANVGVSNLDGISAAVRARTSDLPYKLGVSTFGFGSFHNEALLRGLIQDGAYYFIQDAEMIPTAFGTELGGLISTYATDVVLRVKPGFGVEKIEILNDLKVEEVRGCDQITCHNLLSEQPYTVIAKVTTKGGSRDDRTLPLLEVSAALKDLRLNTLINVDSAVDVTRTTVRSATKKDDEEIMKLVAVQVAEKAQRDAMAAANKGDIHGAQMVLMAASATTQSYGDAQLGTLLRSQVADGYSSLVDYNSKGGKVSSSLSNSFSRQTAGTGGTVQGGVDVDEMFGNEQQKTMAKTFSIKRAARKTDSV